MLHKRGLLSWSKTIRVGIPDLGSWRRNMIRFSDRMAGRGGHSGNLGKSS